MSTSTSNTSSKLDARIAAIRAYDWSEEEKERAIELAVLTHETWSSVTDNGRYIPKGGTGGTVDPYPPRQPYNDLPDERFKWEDAFDPS